MKRTTTNKLNMYQSVYAAMSDYQPVWQDVPAMVAAVNKFGSKLDLLKARIIEQSGSTNGVGMDKQLRTNELLERLLVVERTLMLHGLATGNVLLRQRNKHSKSTLVALSANKLVVRCAELKTDLDQYADQLGDYGIGATIAELLPLLQTIEELKNSTWKAILKRKGATQSINELEFSINKLLSVELDNLMLAFKMSQPAFFQAVSNARSVNDYHYGHGAKPPVEPDDGGMDV